MVGAGKALEYLSSRLCGWNITYIWLLFPVNIGVKKNPYYDRKTQNKSIIEGGKKPNRLHVHNDAFLKINQIKLASSTACLTGLNNLFQQTCI